MRIRALFFHQYKFFFLHLGLLALVGCTTLSETRIGESTAPTDIATNTNSLVTGKYTFSVNSIEVGSLDPEALQAAAWKKARQRCANFDVNWENRGTGVVINNKTYSDAQWLSIVVLCKDVLQTKIGGFGPGLVEENSKNFSDASYFDIHAEMFNADYERVFSTIVRILNRQGDPVYRVDKVRGLIVTGRAEHGGVLFSRYEQYVIALDKDSDTKTQVTFRLLIHLPILAADADPDPIRSRSGQMAFTPAQRKYVYQRAAAFVDALKVALKQ